MTEELINSCPGQEIFLSSKLTSSSFLFYGY